MQKSTKRLLSMLAVLALVLTMAPAGILAVETKAEVQSNIPEATATLMETEAAKQAAAVEGLALLTGTTLAERMAQLPSVFETCPFCGKTPTWEAVNAGGQYGGTGANGRHYYAYGEITKTANNTFHCSADKASFCLLMDNATINANGRILMNKTGSVVNIGGTGTFRSTMAGLVGGDFDTSQNGMFHLMGGSTLNLYGGNFINDCNATHFSKYTGFNRALIHSVNGSAVTNIWSDDVVLGPQEAGTVAKLNLRVQYGVINMYAGTVQNAYCTFANQGWNVFVQNGTFNMFGGTIKDGKGIAGIQGANVNCYASTAKFNMYGGTITGGSAKNGGNIYVTGGSVVLNGLVEKGIAAEQGGNIFVTGNGTVELGNVDVKNGQVTPGAATLGNNIRVSTATLKLSGNAVCTSGILMTANDGLTVTPTFTGNVYLWHTGGVTLGGAVAKSSATAAFTGSVKNGAWLTSTDTYVPVEMMWDGATGLKYPASGVVYNGTLTAAANAQAAVDEFVAAMADEEVTAKPQYVMIDSNVNIGEATVAIDALADITVSGTGTVKGVDRANDAYTATSGSITADGVTVAEDVTAGGRHYVALSNTAAPNKYTFHRVESVLTNITLNLDNAGMYYKAQYQFDAEVAERVVSYGVLVKLDEAVTAENATKYTSSDDMTKYDEATHTLTASSHGVYGIFKTTNNGATNVENGQRKLFGNPYLAINTTGEAKEPSEYPMIDAKSTGMSLYDAIALADQKWESLSEEAQGYLVDFVNKWKPLGAWTSELLESLTNIA